MLRFLRDGKKHVKLVWWILIVVTVVTFVFMFGAGFESLNMQTNVGAIGSVGEQADGYLGVVGSASVSVRSSDDAVNIVRLANYTKMAGARVSTIEEAAASTACEIFARRVGPGRALRCSGLVAEARLAVQAG